MERWKAEVVADVSGDPREAEFFVDVPEGTPLEVISLALQAKVFFAGIDAASADVDVVVSRV